MATTNTKPTKGQRVNIHPGIKPETLRFLKNQGANGFAVPITHTTLAAAILDAVAAGKIQLPSDLLQ